MLAELTITAKNQITLRQAVLDHLGLKPGDKVSVAMLDNGRVELQPAAAGRDLSRLRGRLHRSSQPAVSLEDMQAAIEAGRQR